MAFRSSLRVGFGGLLLTVGFVVASVPALGQPDPQTLDRITQHGLHASRSQALITHLTQRIGARRTGSQSLQRAEEWAMKQFRAWGLQNVALDQWGVVPIGWERGPRTRGQMVAPYVMDLTFSSPAYSAGTAGPLRAGAVMQPRTPAELESVDVKGKWVLMRTVSGMGGGRRPRPLTAAQRAADPRAAALEDVDRALDAKGIAGRVYPGADGDLVHTHGTWDGLNLSQLPTDPRVNLKASQYRRIERQILAGQPVQLEFQLDQRFVPGAVPQYNVVAEIPGTDLANQVVIVGGHLDSWDGPGSQGASDNGTGVITTMEAARLLMASGAKPRRTIRFILWGGEEQGLFGSRHDAARMAQRGSDVMVVLNEDSGSNPHTHVGAWEPWVPQVTAALAASNRVFKDRPIQVTPVPQFPWNSGGSDHGPYLAQGIPALMWRKTGPQVYRRIWHTQHDRLEEVIPDALRQMALNTALTAYSFATDPNTLQRPAPRPTTP